MILSVSVKGIKFIDARSKVCLFSITLPSRLPAYEYSIISVATCTVRNLLHGWSRGQKNEQRNNVPRPKNNAAAGYKDPVKIELLKGSGLLLFLLVKQLKHASDHEIASARRVSARKAIFARARVSIA